jgi:hypothetical protein
VHRIAMLNRILMMMPIVATRSRDTTPLHAVMRNFWHFSHSLLLQFSIWKESRNPKYK